MNKLEIALAQINSSVGDLNWNTSKIVEYVKKAEYDEYRLQVTSWELEKYFEST